MLSCLTGDGPRAPTKEKDEAMTQTTFTVDFTADLTGTHDFTVDLTGTQETPPNASTASGTGTVVWDPDTVTATYEFVVRGLDFGPALGLAPMTAITDDDVTAMHFHNGDRGMAGPVVFGQFNPAQDPELQVLLNDDGSWTISGVWDMTDPANVPIADFASMLESTPAGSDAPLYWNVHTGPFPAGEIRGQLVAQAASMPDEDSILPSICAT
jgi:serralysin